MLDSISNEWCRYNYPLFYSRGDAKPEAYINNINLIKKKNNLFIALFYGPDLAQAAGTTAQRKANTATSLLKCTSSWGTLEIIK